MSHTQPRRHDTLDEDFISLTEIFRTLNHYKWSIIGFTISVTALAVLVVFSLTPIYQATAVLQIEQEEAKVVSIEEVYGLEGGGDSYLNTQYEVLKSRGVMKKVVEQLNLINNPEFNTSLQQDPWYAEYINWEQWVGISAPQDVPETPDRILNNTVDELIARVAIAPVRKTQIVKLNVQSESPQLAADIANAIAGAYIDTYLEAKLSLSVSATNWMQERLGGLEEKVVLATQELQIYRENENLVDLEGVLTISNNELKELTKAQVEARQILRAVSAIYSQIQSSKKNGNSDFEYLPAVLSHPLIQELKQEEAKAERAVQELSRRYGPKHPKMIAAKSDLISIRDSIKIQVNKIINGIETEYRTARVNEVSISKAVDKVKSQVQEINRKQFQLQALERNVQTNKELHDAFFKRIQETSATSDLQTANARIVDNAFVPQNPVEPNKKLFVVIAVFVGLIASCALAFLLDMMNNTIRSLKDVEEKLNLPVLGLLPLIKKKTENQIHQLFTDDSEYGFGEAVRTIRTSLTLTGLDKHRRIFAVTSSVPNEGKSTVGCNIAFAMGKLGNTIIIGCDMRRPTLGKRLGLKGALPGLSNILTESNSLTECVYSVGDIDVIPAGMPVSEPQELLAKNQFTNLIKLLEEKYDNIILDCPPVQNVSDALVLAKVCDGLIYVIETGRVQIPIISACISRLVKASIHISGVVLNKVNSDRKDSYGYNYGYYDYSGYSESSTKKKSGRKTRIRHTDDVEV